VEIYDTEEEQLDAVNEVKENGQSTIVGLVPWLAVIPGAGTTGKK